MCSFNKAARTMQCSEFYAVLLNCKCKHCFSSFKPQCVFSEPWVILVQGIQI